VNSIEVSRPKSASLTDAIDELITKGVVLVGEAQIGIVDIPLIYVGLNLVLGSAEYFGFEDRRGEANPERRSPSSRGPMSLAAGLPRPDPTALRAAAPAPRRVVTAGERRVDQPSAAPHATAQPSPRGRGSETSGSQTALPGFQALADDVRSSSDIGASTGVVQLVLTLVELLRQLMERQAVRRMEGGQLSHEAVERMGLALRELDQKMAELREIFDLTEEDLNLDLGPLGRLLQ
jgi:hypothetical protein